jgi:toxin YoeB
MLNIRFSPQAWEDYLFWQKTNKKIVHRINNLIKECQRDSFKGTGKPEPLKGNLSGWWSRRINEVDRMVYKVDDKDLLIAALRYHY